MYSLNPGFLGIRSRTWRNAEQFGEPAHPAGLAVDRPEQQILRVRPHEDRAVERV